MTHGYAYDHAWTDERIRLAGLEEALDPGTREHLTRLGAGPGSRCLEVGAGGGSIASWLADRVAPEGEVVAIDLETDFLETLVPVHPTLKVLRHDIAAADPPGGFDIAHARYLIEWLPDKRLALKRMMNALRPGGVLLVEEPDMVTMFEAVEPPELRRAMQAAMRHLETTCPIEVEYGRHVVDDLTAVGLAGVEAEGRCPVVRGGSAPAAHFLKLTLLKLRAAVLAGNKLTETEFSTALNALNDPARTFYIPLTVAAWGRRP